MSDFTTNALDELWSTIQEVKDGYDADLVAVDICLESDMNYETGKPYEPATNVRFIVDEFQLVVGTDEDLDKALAPLNKEYDHGFGRQYLFGTIWFTKGIWATRHEYDGSENWEVHVYPNLPNSSGE